MKAIWFILSLVAVLVLALVVAGQLGLLAGKAPYKLGVVNGRLKPPSDTPNSVSSQANLYPDHPQKDYAAIDPITFNRDGANAIKQLADVMKLFPGAVIVKQTEDYLYVQSTSTVFKFTDDMEFWLDPANNVVQVRSSSRLGRKDFGANRTRVEAVRAAFAAVNAKAS